MFAAKELLSSACRLPPGCLKSIKRPEAGSLLEITKGKDFLKNGMLYAVISGGQRSAARNPESGAAEMWRRKMLTGILPNNNRVLAQLDASRHLLSGEELKTVEAFRHHIDDLEAVHIGRANEDASCFPAAMQTILEN